MTPSHLSIALLKWATLGYLAAMTIYIVHLIGRKRWSYIAAPAIAGVTILAHAGALIDRWIQGGLYRPPWTNLYESLVYFSLGLAVVALIIDLRYRLRYVTAFATPLVFSSLGLAYLVPVKEITPLVPSLQSWWILSHSCLAAFAYSGFIVASVVAFLYLIKIGMDEKALGLWTSLILIAGLLLVGGSDVFLHGRYLMTEMAFVGGKWTQNRIPGSDPVRFFEIAVPYVPHFYLASAGLGAIATLLFFSRSALKKAKIVLVAAWIAHVGLIAAVSYVIATYQSVSLGSNPYALTLLILMAAVEAFSISYLFWGERMARALPEALSLERLSYQVTLFAFPFMTLILITGAIWAHEAWGRYWGWDPKETTALVTWLIYTAYLHGRFIPGWSGKKAAVISIIGFFSVIFTYLGTNLVLSGLHSYGSN